MPVIQQDRPILLFGAGGQVGRALAPLLAELGPLVAPSRADGDFDLPAGLREIVRKAHPRLVVNAAAYTAVDDAEGDEARCLRVNAESPRVLAEETGRLGVPIVHYSTNYVFDGAAARPYREDDAAMPINVYGRSKLLGEQAMVANPSHLILRLAGVYAPTGRNFMRRMLDLAREREELRVVEDQFVAPTPASAVAEATVTILRSVAGGSVAMPNGIYHLTSAGSTSWFGFAERIVELDPDRAGQRLRRMRSIASEDLPSAVRRPLNGLLDTGKCARELGVMLPDWEQGLERTISEYAQRR